MSREILRQIGLSDNEAEIYLLMLNMQEALASEIAKKSKISRPHIYDTLAKLIDRGLASYVIKGGRKYFKPANPEVLIEIIKSREMSLQKVLPDLKRMYAPAKEKPVVEVYEGKEGLKTVLKDIVRDGKDISALGPTVKWSEEVPVAVEQYFRQREKIGLKGKLLCPEGTKVIKHPLNHLKFLPKQYSSPATTITYGKKTCFVLWLDTPLAVIVKNKELANSFKGYFDLMWGAETKTYTGKEGARTFLEDVLKSKPKEYMIIGSSGYIAEIMPKYRFEWDKKRVAAGIKTRRIYNDTLKARKSAKVYEHFPLREHRFVPLWAESPLATITYLNKTWIIGWSTKNPLFMLIENKEIAEGFQAQFEQLWHQEERIYHGVEGLKNILMKIVDEKPKEMLIYGSSGVAVNLFPKFIWDWHRKRIKNKIHTKVIYTDTKQSRERLKKLKKDHYYQYKFMPAGYVSPVATIIYNDKVVLMAIMEDGFAAVIEKKEITDIYRKQFDILWKISKAK